MIGRSQVYAFWFYHELIDLMVIKPGKILLVSPHWEVFWVSANSSRLKCLRRNPICVACGKEGVLWILESQIHNGVLQPAHLNLYAIVPQQNGKDGLTLMTQDHIYPRSKGGRSSQDNLQTMCAPCNRRKDNKIEEIKILTRPSYFVYEGITCSL
jgi:hypothetical protein